MDTHGNPNPNYFNEWEQEDTAAKKVYIRDGDGSDSPFAMPLRDKKGFEGSSHSFMSVTTQLYGTRKPSP